ncbi:MAG: hydroxyethylthiazole kinase [Bacillota bacterium]|jgi:hydroxyethylthiazole kinase
MFKDYLKILREKRPLVHNITNYVTVNDCANAILAVGGSPIMSDDIAEVGEIVSLCQALVINIGTLNERTLRSMLTAGKCANQLDIPVILDPVGNGASKLRTQTTQMLLNELQFAVIRGNISEIKAAAGSGTAARGVDASAGDIADDTSSRLEIAQDLWQKTAAAVVITGATDVVYSGNKSYVIKNGHSMLSRITGSGCMCSAITATFCGAVKDYSQAAAAAVTVMGIAGEIAATKSSGTGSFRYNLIDALSMMNDKILLQEMNVEEITR